MEEEEKRRGKENREMKLRPLSYLLRSSYSPSPSPSLISSNSRPNQKFDAFARTFSAKDIDKRTKLKVNESDIIVNLHIQVTFTGFFPAIDVFVAFSSFGDGSRKDGR